MNPFLSLDAKKTTAESPKSDWLQFQLLLIPTLHFPEKMLIHRYHLIKTEPRHAALKVPAAIKETKQEIMQITIFSGRFSCLQGEDFSLVLGASNADLATSLG